jgi:bifunctional enzyme CysN/CysC
VDVNTLEHVATTKLELNEIECATSAGSTNVFEPYTPIRDLGVSFSRRVTNAVGAGLLQFACGGPTTPLATATSRKTWRELLKKANCRFFGSQDCRVREVDPRHPLEKRLNAFGYHTALDGDNVRHGEQGLGFTDATASKHSARREGATDGMPIDRPVSFTPFRAERRMARELRRRAIYEMFVDTPLAFAVRDRDGLPIRRRDVASLNFTGIDSPYEPPEHRNQMIPRA